MLSPRCWLGFRALPVDVAAQHLTGALAHHSTGSQIIALSISCIIALSTHKIIAWTNCWIPFCQDRFLAVSSHRMLGVSAHRIIAVSTHRITSSSRRLPSCHRITAPSAVSTPQLTVAVSVPQNTAAFASPPPSALPLYRSTALSKITKYIKPLMYFFCMGVRVRVASYGAFGLGSGCNEAGFKVARALAPTQGGPCTDRSG